MNRAALRTASLLLAILVGAGVWLWSQPDSTEPPGPGTPPVADRSTDAAKPESQRPPAAPATSTSTRTSVEPIGRTPAATSLPAQGLRGLVLDADHRVMADVEVHLLESAGNDPFGLPQQQQRRHAFSALATTRSGDDGSFAIGLPAVQDKIYELFLVSPRHAITRLGGLRLLAGEWHDLGAITMVVGATLRGQVTVAGHAGIPVPQATVWIDVGTAFDDAALRSLPSQERGLTATVDANGHYEIQHAPSRGMVRVSAVAPGFARAIRKDIELKVDEPVVVDFVLLPGLGISGRVVGTDGVAVAQARVEAMPMDLAGDALPASTETDGRFEILGLGKGKYRLRATALGFEVEDRADVLAGDEVVLTLTPRTTAKVRVRSPGGTILRSYRLGLRRFFAEQGGQVGTVVDVPDQRVRLDGMTDCAVVANVPTGVFVCQIEAEGFAKTVSPSFACGRRDDAIRDPVVEVVMQLGGTVRGIVVDEFGTPLAQATVSTQPDGAALDNPLFKLLAGNLGDRITVLQTKTAEDGSFVLPHLAHAAYQITIEHANACRQSLRGIRIDSDDAIDVGTVRMTIGAEVVGHATIGGRVAGQMKVVLASAPVAAPPGTTTPAAANPDTVRLETVTDANGAFRMPRRVPPGSYELRIAVVGTAEPEAQIFRQLQQLQRSATTISVAPGQRRVQQDLDLPTER